MAREPWDRANIERFRRALEMLGESDPDAIIADRLSGDSPFMATDKLDLNEGVIFDEPAVDPPEALPDASIEVGLDVTDALSAPADDMPAAGPNPGKARSRSAKSSKLDAPMWYGRRKTNWRASNSGWRTPTATWA